MSDNRSYIFLTLTEDEIIDCIIKKCLHFIGSDASGRNCCLDDLKHQIKYSFSLPFDDSTKIIGAMLTFARKFCNEKEFKDFIMKVRPPDGDYYIIVIAHLNHLARTKDETI